MQAETYKPHEGYAQNWHTVTLHTVLTNKLQAKAYLRCGEIDSTSGVAKMARSHGKGNENKERQIQRSFQSFKRFPLPPVFFSKGCIFQMYLKLVGCIFMNCS